jgi:hypothetical protein
MVDRTIFGVIVESHEKIKLEVYVLFDAQQKILPHQVGSNITAEKRHTACVVLPDSFDNTLFSMPICKHSISLLLPLSHHPSTEDLERVNRYVKYRSLSIETAKNLSGMIGGRFYIP